MSTFNLWVADGAKSNPFSCKNSSNIFLTPNSKLRLPANLPIITLLVTFSTWICSSALYHILPGEFLNVPSNFQLSSLPILVATSLYPPNSKKINVN